MRAAQPAAGAGVGPWLLGGLLLVGGAALVLQLQGGEEREVYEAQLAEAQAARAEAEAARVDAEAALAKKPVEKGEPTEAEEAAASELYTEVNTLISAGELARAKQKAQRLDADYGHTSSGKRAKRLLRELAVVGKRVSASEAQIQKWYRGGPVDLRTGKRLVVFWEAWCPHCRRHLPELSSEQSSYARRGIEMVALTKVTKSSSDAKVRAFVSDNDLQLSVAKEDGSIWEEFGVTGIPAAALVKDGTVVWRGHPGRITSELLDKLMGSARSGK